MNRMPQTGDMARFGVFLQKLARRLLQHGEILTSIAQRLEQKGIKKEIQPGKQRGLQPDIVKDKREATLKIARTALHNGIDRNTIMKMTTLMGNGLAQLCY